jgi:hypothetical protein
MRDSPARRSANETKSLLPIDTVDLVDNTIDVVVELGALFLDLAMEGDEFLGRAAQFRERVRLEPAASNHLIMPDWVSAGIALISPQA